MQNTIATLQNTDYVILFQPVLVPKQAIQSLSMMPIPQPMQLPQSIPVQQSQQEETPVLLPPPTGNVKTDEKPRKGMASVKQMEWVLNIAKQRGMSDAEVCQVTGAASMSQMTKTQASAFINDYKDKSLSF